MMFSHTDFTDTSHDGDSRFRREPGFRAALKALLPLWVLSSFFLGSGVGASLVLVEDGRSRAVVVTAEDPGPTVSHAAGKLVQYIDKATGVRLPVVTEAEVTDNYPVRVYLGDTEAARAAGIRADELCELGRREKMAPGVRWRRNHPICLIRVVDGHLYVVGNDHVSAGHILAENIDGGTLYGVNDLLDRQLGVRWLWPGELGAYVPHREQLSLPATWDEIVTPRFDTRVFRRHHIRNAMRSYDGANPRHALSFSEEGLHNYAEALEYYLVNHRVRGSGLGQFFASHMNFWPDYGEKHPEFFMMHEDGSRGPVGGRRDAALCVSNPDLPELIVSETWDGGDSLNLGEIDHRAYCLCPECLEWDEPQPPDFGPHSTSNRYARFWARVRDLAVAINPDVLINVLIYMNYTHAPTKDFDLSNVQGSFCPWFSGFHPNYPKPRQEHEFFQQTWLDWAETGMIMGYRPNYLLFGYVMPHVEWQSGEMFKFAHDHNMAGFDFDSLASHWAARGPMYYLHFRIAARPDLEIAEILEEYYSAFGPAAEAVREYFDYWEKYTRNNASHGGVCRTRTWQADVLYPPESFTPAEAMLSEAMTLARQDARPEYAARVAFLEAGLEHARLAARFVSMLGSRGQAPGEREQYLAAQAALRDLIRFRREHEHLFISDYVAAATNENRSLEIDKLLTDEFVLNGSPEPAADDLIQPWNTWFFRRDPDDRGINERWFEPGSSGIAVHDAGDVGQVFDIDRSRWTRVRVPAALAETEIGDYLGYGWYVTTFTGPEEWRNRPVELHFEGVDEQAWIYVNGQYVGEHTVESEGMSVGHLWNRPFIVVVPAGLINPGEQNLLAVRKHSSAGASGIWLPVGVRVKD